MLFRIPRSTDSLCRLSYLDSAWTAIHEDPHVARAIAKDILDHKEKEEEVAHTNCFTVFLWRLYQLYRQLPSEIALSLSLVGINPAKLVTLSPDSLTQYGLSADEAKQAIAAVHLV